MPYRCEFTPKNRKLKKYDLHPFCWSDMLAHGLGLVLGVTRGFTPDSFVCVLRPDALSVVTGNGAWVSKKESLELAKVARWIARVQTEKIFKYDWLPDRERKRMERENKRMGLGGIYNRTWPVETIDMYIKFARWSAKSGGFRIYCIHRPLLSPR